jgi:hypothetical protein
MQTRKYPRTMKEAFGPYTSTHITETDPPLDWQDWVVMVGSIVTAVVCVLLVLVGWIV